MMNENPRSWLGKLSADPCLRYSALTFLLGVDILSIAALGIGFSSIGKCTIQPNITVYLAVGGVLFTLYYTPLFILLCVITRWDTSNLERISWKKSRALSISIVFMCLFMTIWLTVGCVWVFQAKPTVQFDDPNQSTYCQSTLYNFSFFYCIFLLIICFTHYITWCCMARKT